MEVSDYYRFFIALLGVLGLIGLVAMAAKRLIPGLRQVNIGRTRRVGLVEVVAVDARRKLVLVKRDDVEHLLIVGPNSETVIETNITPPAKIEAVPTEHPAP